MRRVTSLARGIAFAWSQRDDELRDEVAFHIACREDELRSQGLTRAEAARRARMEFGGTEKYRDEVRDVRGLPALESVSRDVAYAWRSLLRSPTLLAVCLLSLGIGIGVNTALFSTVSAIFLSPPTAANPSQLVWVEPGNSNQFSYLNYRDLRDRAIFSAIIGYRPIRVGLRRGNEAPIGVSGMAVTANFFEGLGVAAALGRTFLAVEDAAEGEPRVAVLSHAFWRRHFAADPARVGAGVVVNGEPFTIVGVLPERYQAPVRLMDPDIYLPLSAKSYANLERRDNGNALNVLGRLPPTIGRPQAQAAVSAVCAELASAYPDDNGGMDHPARLEPFGSLSLQGAPLAVRVVPLLLAGLCTLILLISCTNVAGLLLARAAARQREFGLQLALGATRLRLMRALLSESLLLALLGAGAAVLLTMWIMPGLRTLQVPGFGALYIPATVDGRLGLLALALALLTALACGLVPSVRAARPNVVSLLQQGGGHGATSRLRARQLLVVVEVSASFVLLVVSLLFLRTLVRVTSIDTGLDMAHGVVATTDVTPGRFSRARLLLDLERIVAELDATPGVHSSAIGDILPLGLDGSTAFISPAGSDDIRTRTLLNSVGPRYFETMGIALLRGREFGPADRDGSTPVAIVSESFARATFPGEDPIGRRVLARDGLPVEIVGVVRDSNFRYAGEAPAPILYFAYRQRPVSSQSRPIRIHVRAAGDPHQIIRPVRAIVARFDPDAPLEVTTLRDAAGAELQVRRAGTLLFGAMGLLGMFLAMVGLYGVTSYIVESQTSELGVRMALGASGGTILRGVIARGLRLTCWGLALGVVVSIGATRLLVALLAGVSPIDPLSFAGSAAILLTTGLIASYLPARRALRVDPVLALRHE